MPIYQYRCEACGRTFDMKRGILRCTDPATCPACGSAATKKLPSAGIQIHIK